jgi:hypothetical protein
VPGTELDHLPFIWSFLRSGGITSVKMNDLGSLQMDLHRETIWYRGCLSLLGMDIGQFGDDLISSHTDRPAVLRKLYRCGNSTGKVDVNISPENLLLFQHFPFSFGYYNYIGKCRAFRDSSGGGGGFERPSIGSLVTYWKHGTFFPRMRFGLAVQTDS